MRASPAVIGVLVATFLACGTSTASVGGSTRSNLVQTIMIGGTRYAVINAVTAAGYIPNPTVRRIDTLIKACPAVHAFGFFASPSEVGVVVWLPSNVLNCWTTSVSGGGPGSGGNPGCLQGYRSADRTSFILFAGTNSRVCPNVSTQVPGGLIIRGGSYSGWRVKCYARNAHGQLLDYIAPYSATLPASKSAGYILDTQAGGSGAPRAGVPSCFGVRIG